MNNSGAIMADTPEHVAAYRLLAIRSALKLEIIGLRHSRGIRASKLARAELVNAGKQAPANLQKLSDAFAEWLKEIKVLT